MTAFPQTGLPESDASRGTVSALIDPADASISQVDALHYWSSVTPTVDGMLGGYPQISRVDLQGSANFIAKLRRRRAVSSTEPISDLFGRAVDCGAGIGRVTKGLLAAVAEVVDIVEPVAKFTHEIDVGQDFAYLRENGKIGKVYNVGLEAWPTQNDGIPGPYDIIWHQWCLGQLNSTQLVEYLGRCCNSGVLKEGGWIVVKENCNTELGDEDIFDETDSSVTRSERNWKAAFERANVKIVAEELQKGFPRSLGLYPVKTWALQPKA